MNLDIIMKSRNNTHYATATYNEKMVTINAGARLSPVFSDHIRGGKKVLKIRNNPDYVDQNHILLKECSFATPSAAAQFIAGYSINGYDAWKLDNGTTLGDYLKENGLR